MTRYQIHSSDLVEREDDYTGTFTCTDVDTNQSVVVSVTQNKGEPASNLINSLRALAQTLSRHAYGEPDDPKTEVRRLH